MDSIFVLKKFIGLIDVKEKKSCICFTVNYYEEIGLLSKEESFLLKDVIKKNKPDILHDKELSASYFKEKNRIRNKLGYLPNQYYYFQSSDWNTRRRYLELLVKYLENERDSVLKLEFDDKHLKSIDVNTDSDLDSEHLFETYKPVLHKRCDEACFYHCSKGGQQEPDCTEHCQKEVKKTSQVIYEAPVAITPRRTENKNYLDIKTLNERLDVLNKKKQSLLSLKKEFRQDLPGVLDSIKRIKGWIKSLE